MNSDVASMPVACQRGAEITDIKGSYSASVRVLSLSAVIAEWDSGTTVDTPPPETFSDRDLLVALTGHWDLRADRVRYVPKGAGSYHWVVAARFRSPHQQTRWTGQKWSGFLRLLGGTPPAPCG